MIQGTEDHAVDPTVLLGVLTQKVQEILVGFDALAAETKMLALCRIINRASNRLATLLVERKKGQRCR
jgi:hypothetical protein